MADGSVAGDAAYLQGRPCPKCAYVRTAADTNPPWQCPRCGIAYSKLAPRSSKLGRMVQESRALVDEGVSDGSTYSLIAVNVLAGAIAVMFRWNMFDLLLVYWAQSVVIGISFFVRMLSAKRYAMMHVDEYREHFVVARDNDSSGKVGAALTFLLHFGLVHAGYLVILVTHNSKLQAANWAGLALCALAFAGNHAYSLARNIERDRSGIANLSLMGFLPYLRVVPMQAVMVLGVKLEGGTGLMMLFVGLKTAVDVLTHLMEHHEWRREGPPVVPEGLSYREPEE